MARKPNYDFERREREKAKAAKLAERAKAKAEKRKPSDAEETAADAAIPADKLNASNDE